MLIHRLIKPIRVLGVVVALFGAALTGVAIVKASSSAIFLHRGVQAWGAIVDTAVIKANGSATYVSVFEFTDEAGTTHRVNADWATSVPMQENGRTVSVVYMANDPTNARIAEHWRLWGVAEACAIFGVPMLVGGLLMIFWAPGAIRRFWPIEPVTSASDLPTDL